MKKINKKQRSKRHIKIFSVFTIIFGLAAFDLWYGFYHFNNCENDITCPLWWLGGAIVFFILTILFASMVIGAIIDYYYRKLKEAENQ